MATFDPSWLEILRCPLAVQDKSKTDPGRLELVREHWLYCAESGYKYPIRNGIPVMLIEEGAKWKDVAIDQLPTPPPEK
ncbi:MAG: Trm112 family protein [Anaerolineae bacterium]|nr:Trm112 family protein [Anaerolineae bacterium]